MLVLPVLASYFLLPYISVFAAPTQHGSNNTYYVPDMDPLIQQRLLEIRRASAGYLYGPSLLGNTSFFPTGTLGGPMVQRDVAQWQKAAALQTQLVPEEAKLVAQTVVAAGGLTTLDKYILIHKDQWKRSNPTGVAPGFLTNYTQDLFFSMERLSTNPFAVERVNPDINTSSLPYKVDDAIVERLVGRGYTFTKLHKEGRLFIADHSYQRQYQRWVQRGRFAAACTAYFYIHPTKKQFLPLSIKTNVGSDLIYTPLDSQNDWLLAKIAFNANDLFHGQIYHLASSHAVAEIVHEAALRTMSTRHPVLAYLNRLMYQAYAIRPVGSQVLFNPGGFFDQTFAYTNEAVREFATEFYPKGPGKFVSNYLLNNLRGRGLIDYASNKGPNLPSFPFADDSTKIVKSMRKFFTVFVRTYYPSELDIFRDDEVQDWTLEAIDHAGVVEFPSYPLTRAALIDVLTHIAYLTGVNHHALNSGTPCATSGTLPMHPAALFSPLPTSKGSVPDLVPFLPNLNQSLTQIGLLTRFNRPNVTDEDGAGALVDMFENNDLKAASRREVRIAANEFKQDMLHISGEINGKKFDADGLCQGEPYIWRGLDPVNIPFYLSV